MVEYDKIFHQMDMFCDEDTCNESSTFYGEWHECIRESKEEGWRSFKNDNDEWQNKCPFCMEKGKHKNPFTEIE